MTSDYRVSPQRSSSTIVSRLLRDLFRSSPATTPRESSTSSACVASIVNELSGNQARSAVADPTPPSHLRAPDFSGPPTSDICSQSIGSIRLCSLCSSSCSSSPRIHVTFFPNKFLTPSSALHTLLPTAVHHRFPPAPTRRFPPFSLFHLRQCVLVSFQYASSTPICFTTPPFKMHYTNTTTFPPLFSFYIFSTAAAPLQRWRGMLDCIPLCSQLRAYPYAYTLLPLYYISTDAHHAHT